jgi:hypothetical protein
MVGEGDVGAAGVLTREAPFSLAVANQKHFTWGLLAVLHCGYLFERYYLSDTVWEIVEMGVQALPLVI